MCEIAGCLWDNDMVSGRMRKEQVTAMVRTLLKEVKEFKTASFMTPVFMVLEVFMETLIPYLMATMIDQGIEQGNLPYIFKISAVMLVLAAVGLWAGIMGGKYGAKASTGFGKNLREAMYRKIQTFSFSNIDKFSTAGLVTRLTTDVTNIQNAYQMILRMCVRAPISLVCAMGMAFFINARIASIYLVAVLLLACCLALIIRFTMKYFSQVFEKYDELNASVQENVTAQRVVKAFVREEYEIDKFHKASSNIYKMFVKAEGLIVLNMPLMQFAVYSCILLISWVGAKMIVVSGGTALTTGELTSLLNYCMNILMNLMMLSMVFVMITMSLASGRRICEVLTEEPALRNPTDPVRDVADGSIRFENVTFRYNANSESPVLDHINLDIRSGETIGLLGGT